MAIKSFSIRVDEDMLNKRHMVADDEGHSANSQVLVLIKGPWKNRPGRKEKAALNWGGLFLPAAAARWEN